MHSFWRIHLFAGARAPCVVSTYKPLDAGLYEALNGTADVPAATWSAFFLVFDLGRGRKRKGEKGSKREKAPKEGSAVLDELRRDEHALGFVFRI